MGLLDDMEGKALQSLAGSNPTMAAVMQMINNHPGGISGLLQQFHDQGLGSIASSWVGTGPNQAISPGDLHRALGPDLLQQLAAKTGMSVQELSEKLAQALPQAVDKMTPGGTIPKA